MADGTAPPPTPASGPGRASADRGTSDRGRPGKRRSLVRGSAIAIAASALSIVASLLLDVVVAAKFGANSATDTFWVAARLPIAITAIVMVGGNQALDEPLCI